MIDAANDPELLVKLVGEHAPKLALIVTTHQHFDHWQALEAVAGATSAPTAAHQLDAEPLPVAPDRFLAAGDTVSVGDLTFDVIHLRGHTPARWPSRCGRQRNAPPPSCSPAIVFPGGGRTTTPEEFDSLMTGLRRLASSTSTATTPSYIPVTATTPSSVRAF